jgi:acetylornithine deacetylase
VEWFGGRWQPGSLRENHPLLGAVSESYKEVFKEEPVIEASPWGTDGGILSRYGGTPVVVFGPGITETAHDANEHIILEDLYKSAEIIALTLLKWCGVDSQGEGEQE